MKINKSKSSDWSSNDKIHDYLHRYPLNKDSLIVDIGGYTGVWLSRMSELYECRGIGVEPIKEYAEEARKVNLNNNVEIYNFGLTVDDDDEAYITFDNDASSIFKLDNIKEAKKINLKNAKNFFDSIPKNIDVLQINAEGLEYQLIPYLVDNKLIESVSYIQIQFHHFIKDSDELMKSCIKKIEKNGFATSFQYPYIWYGAKRNSK